VLGQRLLDGLNRLDKPGRVPYFIYLAVCESASPKLIRTLAFGSLARRLVEDLGVPALIAMTEKVEIQTAPYTYQHLLPFTA